MPVVQDISTNLQQSATELNDSVLEFSRTVDGFTAVDAGHDYHSQGERVISGLDGLRKRMFMWANCVNDTGAVLGQAATMNGEIDLGSAAAIAQNSVSV
ncbi:hypothetical protein AB0L57_12550 [Nocardia sp. NPDC052254]|uniref:hypothetical protein n=1 Tax=Nocardia sp. NPDC052254 TaxID=3155681 RepID=UPI00344450BF